LSDRRFHIPIHCIRVAVEGFAFPIPAMTGVPGKPGLGFLGWDDARFVENKSQSAIRQYCRPSGRSPFSVVFASRIGVNLLVFSPL